MTQKVELTGQQQAKLQEWISEYGQEAFDRLLEIVEVDNSLKDASKQKSTKIVEVTVEATPERLQEIARSLNRSVSDARQESWRQAVPQKRTGAQLLADLKALNLPAGYGDPSIDSLELARTLRERFSRRQHDAK